MNFERLDIHLKNKFGTFSKFKIIIYIYTFMLFMQFNANYLFIFNLTIRHIQ